MFGRNDQEPDQQPSPAFRMPPLRRFEVALGGGKHEVVEAHGIEEGRSGALVFHRIFFEGADPVQISGFRGFARGTWVAWKEDVSRFSTTPTLPSPIIHQ